MRIEQLKYMLEVTKTHSVSIAAENLYISQSTISDAIKKLEEELGVQLFERTKQGMFLTAVGEKIKDHVECVENEIRTIVQIAAETKLNSTESLEGNLNIYTVFFPGYQKLGTMLSDFQQKYPKINIRLLEESFVELIRKIQTGAGDIGIVYCSSEHDISVFSGELEYKVISTENFYALIRRDSKLAHKSSVSMKEIIKYPLSIFCFNDVAENMTGDILKNFLTKGETLKNTFQTNSIELLQNHIVQHNTVGFALGETALCNIELLPELMTVKIADKMKIKMYFVYRKDSDKLSMIESFWDILQGHGFFVKPDTTSV